MKNKFYIIILSLICVNFSFAQNGAVYETYKYQNGGTNSSHGSIFRKPFQEYNYIKTRRGIEVYETYKYQNGGTNSSHGSVISKPFPTYIIVGDRMYRTYTYKNGSTNSSHGSIFNKPFEGKIIDPTSSALKANIQQQINNYKYVSPKYSSSSTYNGPTYDGETFSEGSSE